MPEVIQRATAFKLRIGDILRGKPAVENERLNFLELGDKQILRVNVAANIIEKFRSEGEKNYASLTIDDASGQIRIKIFGDDVEKYKGINQGDTVIVVGLLKFYNNEVYISPDFIKIQDPRYLLVRKLELEKDKSIPVKKEEILVVKDQLIEMIKNAEDNGGIDIDKLVIEIKASPEIINQEITKLIEEGLVYEPRPGKIRYLG